MSVADIARRVSKLAIDHSPTILTTVGVVGTITTAYLAGKVSFEAADMIRLKEGLDYRSEDDRRDPRERIKDRVELVWKLYIPVIATGSAAVTCIIAANTVGNRRYAAMAAATSVLERGYDEYKAKVIEKIGEKKEELVRSEIAADRFEENPPPTDVALFGVSEGELCYDKFSDRYFLGSVEGINAAVNSLNNSVNHDGYASLADLYRLLDQVEIPSYAEGIGWNHDRLVEVRFSSALAHGNKPVIVMDFKNEPSPDYGRFH